jgi:hypothetical protein
MSPKLGLLVAVPETVGLLAASPAEAYWRRGHWFGPGPAIAGAIVGLGVGAAIAGAYPRPYYAPPPVVYAPPPVVYAPPPVYYGYPGYYR